jgi:hypothetical protein
MRLRAFFWEWYILVVLLAIERRGRKLKHERQ